MPAESVAFRHHGAIHGNVLRRDRCVNRYVSRSEAGSLITLPFPMKTA